MLKIKNYLKNSLMILAGVVLLGAATALPAMAAPDPNSPQSYACAGVEAAGGTCNTDTADGSIKSVIGTVINILSMVVGAVAVIMIIIGGLRYVLSGGDSNGVTGAKNTIMYALIGLVIVLFAQVIVKFVLTKATETPAATPPAKTKTN